MASHFQAPNYHMIQAGYSEGRVWMKSERFKDRISVPYDYTMNGSLDIAWNTLQRLGFKLVGSGEWKDSYMIVSSTFIGLREAVKAAKTKAKANGKKRR